MARDWHELFKSWAKAPSDREEAKGSTAAAMVKDALRSHPALKTRTFEVYPTGSYRNNTNVRLGSDIDVAVVLTEAFYADYPSSGLPSQTTLGFTDATYGLNQFRDDVGQALIAKFGMEGVSPANKTFNVHESSRRLDADVTAFCEYRYYTGQKNPDGSWQYYQGVQTRSRRNPEKAIINWHQQHYDRGGERNNATNRRFKRLTRILKQLREDMKNFGSDKAAKAAEPIPSFLIECLVYNAPDVCFNREQGSYYQDVNFVLLFLWDATKDDARCSQFVEVSEMKRLFGSTQPWTRSQANEFLFQAWRHAGFGESGS